MAKRSRDASPVASPETPSARSPSMPPSPSSSPSHRRICPDVDSNSQTSTAGVAVMRCSLPPHKEVLSFSTYEEYEVHYAQVHVNRCSGCGKNFPTGRFLTLHIEENHDPLNEARRERGERTFGCFVEGCERKCSTPQKRRMHLIDKHMFPRTYNFFIVNDGIDKHSSLLRNANGPTTSRRRVSTPSSPQHEGRLRRRKLSQSISNSEAQNLTANESHPSATVPSSQRSAPIQHPTSRSDLRAQRNSTPSAAEAEVDADADPIADLEKSMSALRFVPTSVTLRHEKLKMENP
ncbi:hypothetical protein AJ80_02508 [Polytolypa hystricis UAMH7299]|uniref:C2H2-type domain-containing protein n=1 Tax=Polytolypa hystricis (strain UAMH7299) TaxID=1447883 RepID=A0A2B7YR96_POLH7|nr:hypothetical protein AJ80_02508 [Polytolypa hystricis UAMH7299]